MVSSDADLIYALPAIVDQALDEERGVIEEYGSLDELETREVVIRNIEGGLKAFKLQSQKYDVSLDDHTQVVLDVNQECEKDDVLHPEEVPKAE